jgi:hypothetical protein
MALREHSIREMVVIKRIAPHVCAMLLLFNSAHILITSGEYHTYRGVLSRQGQYLKELWLELLTLLETENYFTSEEADRLVVRMTESIAQMG